MFVVEKDLLINSKKSYVKKQSKKF